MDISDDLSNLQAVSMLCYIMRSVSPPQSAEEYCRGVLSASGREMQLEQTYCIGIKGVWSVNRTVSDYKNMVMNEQMDDFGEPVDTFVGIGPDGREVVALLFRSLLDHSASAGQYADRARSFSENGDYALAFREYVKTIEVSSSSDAYFNLILNMCLDMGVDSREALKAFRNRSVDDFRSLILESLIKDHVKATMTRDGALMALIPAGEFEMGSDDGNACETPVHTIYLEAFYMDKYEVTNLLYREFIDATGYKAPKYWDDPDFNAPDQPVVGVDWEDAKAYAEWAGKRLPTEAEWEKAARGGLASMKYPWGNEITEKNANYYGKNSGGTTLVGKYAPNGYGLYDMAGNAWEWCSDWHDEEYYVSSPERNPQGPDAGSYRVLRGGSWNDSPSNLRVATRYRCDPTLTYFNIGFRCCASRSEYKNYGKELRATELLDKDWTLRHSAVLRILDQNILMEIARLDTHPNVRIAAIKRIMDQGALVDVVRSDRVPEVRKAAVRRIKDPNALSEIATSDKNPDIRVEAVKGLADECILVEVAKLDESVEVCRVALRKINRPALLAEVATSGKNAIVCIAAIDKIDDQKTLAEVATSAASLDIRKAAFTKITDENALSKIAKSNCEVEFCMTAVDRIMDRNLLMDIAKSNIHINVLIAAIGRLTDDNLLTEVAKNDGDIAVCKAALRNITDQNMLAEIAKSDNDDLSISAIEMINDKDILSEIAGSGPFSGYSAILRISAIQMIDDTNVLTDIAKHGPFSDFEVVGHRLTAGGVHEDWVHEICEPRDEWRVRNAALRRIDDQATLIEIAESREDAWICIEAVKRINDQEVLMEIAMSEVVLGANLDPGTHNKETINLEFRRAAVERINDQAMLAEIAKSNPNSQIRVAAVEKLVSQDLLVEIAMSDDEWTVRKAVIDRVNDQEILTRVARYDENDDVRYAAIKRITNSGRVADQKLLSELARTDSVSAIRMMAANRISDQKILAEIAMFDSDAEVYRTAAEKLTNQDTLTKITKYRAGCLNSRIGLINSTGIVEIHKHIDSCLVSFRCIRSRIKDRLGKVEFAVSAPRLQPKLAEYGLYFEIDSIMSWVFSRRSRVIMDSELPPFQESSCDEPIRVDVDDFDSIIDESAFDAFMHRNYAKTNENHDNENASTNAIERIRSLRPASTGTVGMVNRDHATFLSIPLKYRSENVGFICIELDNFIGHKIEYDYNRARHRDLVRYIDVNLDSFGVIEKEYIFEKLVTAIEDLFTDYSSLSAIMIMVLARN